jgi:hypothetical protein
MKVSFTFALLTGAVKSLQLAKKDKPVKEDKQIVQNKFLRERSFGGFDDDLEPVFDDTFQQTIGVEFVGDV